MLDRPWADLFLFHPSTGYTLYRIRRDRRFWSRLLLPALSAFWWGHVVEAKLALAALLDVQPEQVRATESGYGLRARGWRRRGTHVRGRTPPPLCL